MMTEDEKLLFNKAREYAFSYMENLADRPVFPDDAALENLKEFYEPLPETPCPGADILDRLHRYGSPATVAQTGSSYFGFVNGGCLPAAQASQWLSTAWDQNAALYLMSPLASCLETICQQWLIELLGLPEECVAALVSGSSLATLSGLAAARHDLLARQGWDVNGDGLAGAPPLRVVLGEQAHSSVFKALAILGFGRNQLELVVADGEGRLRVDKLPQLDERSMVIAQAGNVNSGAFDDIDAIAERVNTAGGWLHVDGAFGLWCAASKSRRHLTKGIDRADSWAVDGHKSLNGPYDCGIILCRHPKALAAAMQASGSYIHYSSERDGMVYVPEMSRRARSVELWATMKALGRAGIEELVDSLHTLALQLAGGLEDNGFQIVNEVVFNQVLVACKSGDATRATLANIQKSGRCWCGGATWQGEPVIRVSICSWRTGSADIEAAVASFVEARPQK
ncbi:MAG: pyridoxal-dependent decarboxylase [Thermodesulfobacteriota bacterium]